MSCPRFVQNAWKKDLCSNCFKGKEDHAPVVDNRARYLANLREITKRPPPPGILKGVIRKNVSAFKVHFPKEESHVIGYGGDELSDYEDEEIPRVEETGTIEEDSADEEEYRKFQELTESNTEFNKDPSNLLVSAVKAEEKSKKQTTTSLKLGQIKSTPDGKKQTLLVSVQPFGTPTNSTPLAVSRKTHLNNLLHDAADSLNLSNTSEMKSSLMPTIKSDVESNKTEVSCDSVSSQSIICSNSLPAISHVNNIIVDNKPDCKDNVQIKDVPKCEENVEDDSKKTERNAENRLSSLIEGKRNHIIRGTILTKSHEQVKSKRYYQVDSDSPEDDLPISESIYKKFESDLKSKSSTFSKAKDTIKLKSNFQHNNVKNIANGLFSSKLLKKEFGIQSDLQLTRMKSLDYIETNPSVINQGVGKENEPMPVKGDGSILNDITSLLSKPSLDNTGKDEVLLIDGIPAESREMAGEPDGRADSDDTDEPPPELPTTPPPLLTDPLPRSSFLHNLTKEKPKLPVKPKLREKSPPTDLALDIGDQSEPDPNLSPTTRHSLITKRQAPKPPPGPFGESPPKGEVTPPEQSPPGRRERAASCSPLPSDSSGGSQTPEPVARRSLSLSHEALANSAPLPALDKKKPNKMRTTLRKFLRLASRDEMKGEEVGPPPLPPPRPRPEIIHPLDLNKSAVQVLRGDGSLVTSARTLSSSSESPSSPTTPVSPGFNGRPSKPPPPPRSHSLDSALGDSRPARPPPPSTSVYVNLGEVRSSIAPAKPQRTASLREKDKDPVDSACQSSSELQMSENLYESVVPECDLNRERTSLPYYGSETESDIYCPYTFTSSFKRGEEIRTKTRSVVHKSLEENYSAVTVTNHEALTQLLDQVSQAPVMPQALRTIKGCSSLQWTDFTVTEGGEEVGSRVFLPATWNQTPVSLCLTSGQSRLPPCFHPVTQFFDVVASKYLHQDKTELVQVSVAVLTRQEFHSLASLSSQLSSSKGEVAARLAALVMLQVVDCLKTLQAQGHEEASLSQLVSCREDHQSAPRVCLLPCLKDKGADCVSLCHCATQALSLLNLPQPLATILHSLLSDNRVSSLAQAQATIELWLWGPTHVPISADSQASLQRWLDLERANVLQSLAVRRPTALSSSDYCHLSFLVRSNAKVMSDALTLLASNTST